MYDASSVAMRRDAPPEGPWPDEVASVSASEDVFVRDDGSVRRGVLVSWTRPDTPVPWRGFRVHFRPVSDNDEGESWIDAGTTGPEATSFLILDRCVPGATYEFAAVPIGPNCCVRRPPTACRVRVTLRVLGDSVAPAAPTGLRILQLGDRALLRWEPVALPGTPIYEVRAGSERYDLADVVARTTMPEVALGDIPPLGHVVGAPAVSFHVTAIASTGVRGSPARVTASPVWGDAADIGTPLLSAPGWLGTKSGCTTLSGALVVSSGTTEATYTSPAVDFGSLRDWRVLVLVLARRTNLVLTPRLAQFAPRSWWGRRWAPNGRAEEAHPQNPVPRRGTLSPRSAFGGPAAMRGHRPTSFAQARPTNRPALTPNEARFSPNSPAGRSTSPNAGVGSTAGTGYSVEIRFSDDAVTWTAWEPYVRQTRACRHAQVRLTLRQPRPAMRISIDDLCVVGVRVTPAQLTSVVADVSVLVAQGVWAEDETPSGTIDGINDTFTIASTPVPGSFPMLFKNGVLQRRGAGADFTISGTTITYAAGSLPAPGDWHRIWYRY